MNGLMNVIKRDPQIQKKQQICWIDLLNYHLIINQKQDMTF